MKQLICLCLLFFCVTLGAQSLYAPDGKYLGEVNNNPYDQNSINNPYGKYGNPYSSDSVNNPYGKYGNKYSNQYSNPYGR